MKIEDIITEVKQGKGYGSLQLDKESIDKVNKVLKELKIAGGINDLHITTIYDRSNPHIDFDVDSSKEYSAKIEGIKMLGEPDSKWYAIALTLISPEIENRHKDYIDAGFKHSYPKFLPHMSLKYKPTNKDIATIKNNLDKFNDLNLIFSGERLMVIKE